MQLQSALNTPSSMKKVPLFSFTKFMAQLFLAHLFPFWLKSSPESWELAYSRTPLFKKQHWGEFSHSSPSNFARGNSLSIPNLKNLHFFNQNGDYPLVFPNIAIAGISPFSIGFIHRRKIRVQPFQYVSGTPSHEFKSFTTPQKP